MKIKLLPLGMLTIVVGLMTMPDIASAQSGGRKGGDVIQKCYGKDGRPHRCERLNEKGEVKPEFRKNKTGTK